MIMSGNIKFICLTYSSFPLILLIFLVNINIISALFDNKQINEHLGSTGKHLLHFVQVTDIHITHDGNDDRMKQFEQFCNEVIKNIVKPKVTLVSGDLVNNVGGLGTRSRRIFASGQYEEEWKIYRNILDRTNVTKYTKWLDIRGNHDTFMDSDPDSLKSFYRIYSHQGHDHLGSYEYTLTTNEGDNYSFIGVDLCPRPGLGAPLNFFGRLNSREYKKLIELSEKSRNSSSIIFFGHYPLSFTYSSGLHQIMKHAIVYLNGHLHSGIKHLYTLHPSGLLELELGDWKRKRRFRIVTIDSGLLSFEDFQFNEPIYAVISNPKAAKFHTPREAYYRINQSTHIRIVIFSKSTIVSVKVSIDKRYLGLASRSIDNENLFILPWKGSFYNDQKLHEIFVEIKDKEKNLVIVKHQFSLSLSIVTKWNYPRIVLTIHQPTFGLIVFISSLFGYLLVLSYFRYEAKQKPLKIIGRFLLWTRFRTQMTLLCSIDLFFYVLISFTLWNLFGPWYIGYLTEDHFGLTALWGTIVQRNYLPPDSPSFVGTIQFYFFVFPLTFNLSSTCFYRYHQLTNLIQSRLNRCFRIYSVYILFVYTFLISLLFSYIITASYGPAWIISPFGLLLPIGSLILYIISHRLKLEDFQLKSQSKTTEMINPIDQVNFKLLELVDQQQADLYLSKSQ